MVPTVPKVTNRIMMIVVVASVMREGSQKRIKLLRNFFVTAATLTTKTEYSKSRKEIAERATRIINSKREIEKLKKTARKIVKL